MTTPLKWNLDWKHLTRREKFLMGAPFVATEDRAYQDIIRQLDDRKASDMESWSELPSDVRELACRISNALKTDGIWPSEFFVPDDPADIPFALNFDFTDKWDLSPYAIDLVEKRLGIQMPMKFWEHIPTMTYAEAIIEISRQKTKQVDAPDGKSAVPPFSPMA